MINGISQVSSERLHLTELQVNDYNFIFELVDSPGWLNFIGDRNVKSATDALAYIEKIIANPDVQYWTVRLKGDGTPIGIITLIKRQYLDHYDIGFAFLEAYTGKGYAAEATLAVVHELPHRLLSEKILAITTEANLRSIKLLEELNFIFEKTIEVDNKILRQYALNADQIQIDKMTQAFFALFTNIAEAPQFDRINELCHQQAQIVKKTVDGAEIYDLKSFIEPRKKILTDGTLTGFSECEVKAETRITGNIAQRFSRYEKSGRLQGSEYRGSGNKMLQFMKQQGKWQIIQVIWEDNA
ncbi:GNAT family N-acetyltransferase [Mucilaginibacter sp. 21P]|uniref:GNAT family N-acetyltransferase n=1 Tax=Mucilaginibacter sp. 21P TaxID=2778902 RepID=UPI001C573317|nr:GNAT family N-acetyltransferase [Mucilaginibacter sp. 21P]QXV63779.1 GNAT family N-acetyltransferase [Mucilaginibacter sp. 21P]